MRVLFALSLLCILFAAPLFAADFEMPGLPEYVPGKPLPPIPRPPKEVYEVPYYGVENAYESFYHKHYRTSNPAKAKSELRLHLLELPPEEAIKNGIFIRNHHWHRDFIELFEEAAKWIAALRSGAPEIPYLLSKAYAAEKPKYNSEHISFHLLHLAFSKGHKPARFEVALTSLEGPRSNSISTGRNILEELADAHYKPALLELISQFFTGVRFPKNDGAAYYWFRRAELYGMDLTLWRDKLNTRISDDNKRRAEKWIKRGAYPNSWDYEAR